MFHAEIACDPTHWLHDFIEMHYKQTKRTPRESPDILWLIDYSQFYLSDACIDIGCRALDAISMELGDYAVRIIDEDILNSKSIMLRKYADESIDLCVATMSNLNFAYPHTTLKDSLAMQLVNNSSNKTHTEHKLQSVVPIRIRKLTKCGMYMEALSLLNGYLEVFFKHTLHRIFYKAHHEPPRVIRKMSHRYTLQLFKKLSDQEDFTAYIRAANEIYLYRNLYLHELEHPNEQAFMSSSTRKHILNLIETFMEPYKSHLFILMTSSLEEDCVNNKFPFLLDSLSKISEKFGIPTKQ